MGGPSWCADRERDALCGPAGSSAAVRVKDAKRFVRSRRRLYLMVKRDQSVNPTARRYMSLVYTARLFSHDTLCVFRD